MLFERKRVTQKVVIGLPRVGSFFVRHTPSPLLKASLERGLNTAFRSLKLRKEMSFIKKHCILIQVTDIDLCFSVGFDKNCFTVTVPSYTGDVTVSAEMGDFIALISGKEDPDTLFFRRRLRMTGDTELGLGLKNFLDRVEVDTIFPSFVCRGLVEVAEGFMEGRSSRKTAAE